MGSGDYEPIPDRRIQRVSESVDYEPVPYISTRKAVMEIKHDFRVFRVKGMDAELILEFNSEEPAKINWIELHGEIAEQFKQGDLIEVTIRKKEN